MKPILPLFISLTFAAGFAFAQRIDPDDVEIPPASGEESVTDETDREADGESIDESDSEDADGGISDESAEPASEAAPDETADAEEADEELAGEDLADEDLADEDLADESADSESDPQSPEEPEEGLAEAVTEEEVPVESDPVPPQPGLAVRVERVQGGEAVDPSEVRLSAPFPAKLLAEVPEGWRIEKSDRAPAFTREVELSPGSKITLSVQPHILVPEADGAEVFAVNEPGYRADLGYRQDATVGAILATSIRQLDDDARQLGDAIDQLQQLLVSLPRTEPAAQGQPAPGSKR